VQSLKLMYFKAFRKALHCYWVQILSLSDNSVYLIYKIITLLLFTMIDVFV